MIRKRTIWGLLIGLGVVAVFLYAQIQIGITSLKLDLRWIGESIYEARQNLGRWPAGVEDLEGTKIVRDVPRLKAMIAAGHYVVHWPGDMALEADKNAERILAYDNHSRLSVFGRVWACRGDLTVTYIDRALVE